MLGNTLNYSIGRAIGPAAFSGRYRLLKQEYLQPHGGVLRCATAPWPCFCRASCRSSAPLRPSSQASAACPRALSCLQPRGRASAWVLLFIWGGYLFGNIPIVKDNFGLVTIGIIVALAAALRGRLPQAARGYLSAQRRADHGANEQDRIRQERQAKAEVRFFGSRRSCENTRPARSRTRRRAPLRCAARCSARTSRMLGMNTMSCSSVFI